MARSRPKSGYRAGHGRAPDPDDRSKLASARRSIAGGSCCRTAGPSYGTWGRGSGPAGAGDAGGRSDGRPDRPGPGPGDARPAGSGGPDRSPRGSAAGRSTGSPAAPTPQHCGTTSTWGGSARCSPPRAPSPSARRCTAGSPAAATSTPAQPRSSSPGSRKAGRPGPPDQPALRQPLTPTTAPGRRRPVRAADISSRQCPQGPRAARSGTVRMITTRASAAAKANAVTNSYQMPAPSAPRRLCIHRRPVELVILVLPERSICTRAARVRRGQMASAMMRLIGPARVWCPANRQPAGSSHSRASSTL